MSSPIVQIGDLALDEPGSFKIGPFGSSLKKNELVSSGIPVIGIENVLPSEFVPNYRKFITEKKYQELAQYTVQSGDIVVTTMGTIGRAAVVPDGIGIAIIDSHLFRMRFDKTKVYPPYLCYAINGAPSVINHLEKMSRGAIMDGLNTTILKESPLALPPLTEQKRIASLLARADRLRKLRENAYDLGDTLLQSVFLEMFGEALNGKNPEIPLVPLETLCTKITDGTHVTPNYIESGVPFVSIKDLTRTPGTIDFSDTRFISREEHEKISKLSNVERDDILYTKVGSYGIAQIVDTDREFSIFVSVALLKPDKSKILPKFFEIVMNSNFVKRQADMLVSGIGVPDLHLREIKTFQIPLPPLSLQEEFAGVVARVEGLRGRMSEAEGQVEGLFESLLSESFGGGA